MPTNMAFHDLTKNKQAPPAAKSLLGLGSKFIITPEYTNGKIAESESRIRRDFSLAVFFASGNDEFLDECAYDQYKNRSKLYVKSKFTPNESDLPGWAFGRLDRFLSKVRQLFKKRKATSNLLPYQQEMMETLLNDPELLFPEADKGLGPCAVTYDQYVEDCLKQHLLNRECYRILTEEEAMQCIATLRGIISAWLKKFNRAIGDQAVSFIQKHMSENATSPFGQFYALYKIHKGMKNGAWPTRPVCSDVTSLTHGLGKWVNEQLVPAARKMKSYFKDSFALKRRLDNLVLPPNALLFTCDATAMYTNLKTDPCLDRVTDFITKNAHLFKHCDREALIEALPIIFKNNYFKFGDIFCHQTSGTAMGTPPAPSWATITFGIHEEEMILPKWKEQMPFYLRFIDDGIGIWLVDDDPQVFEEQFKQFQHDMQGWYGLEWTFTTPSTTIDFMDLTISIVDGKIETTIFEKAQNLYLYIPPHSSHPRGVLTGLICGQVLRFRRLCSKRSDSNKKIKEFAQRLLARGHSREDLEPIFAKAEKNALNYLRRSQSDIDKLDKQKWIKSKKQIFLHLQYHPEDPQSREIQKLWTDLVSHPAGDTPLSEMKNGEDEKVGFSNLVVAYSRPLNLGNRFTIRDIHSRGRPVSEYLAE